MDIVSAAVRSRIMSKVRGKNTKPEKLVRSMLHREGLRFRIHVRTLPGKPDIVLPRWNAIILVHGCFWHGHDCRLFSWPATRGDFWKKKILRNREVDTAVTHRLRSAGWRVMTVYECAIKGRERLEISRLQARIATWVRSGRKVGTIKGKRKTPNRAR
jgi:DNA mismatch endonuclease (patch repair protein)